MGYIELNHVSKKIGKNEVLRGICLNLEKNKIYGIQGINGSGKTMLLRAVCGLIRTTGEVLVNGENPIRKGEPLDIGVMIEMPGFLKEFTGKENLRLLALLQNKITEAEIDKALSDVGLNPEDGRKYGKYSLGMKQRLGIAQAILGRPELILLDEPTNAVDAGGIEQMIQLIRTLKEEGATLLIASHDRHFLDEVADQVIEMEGGRIL